MDDSHGLLKKLLTLTPLLDGGATTRGGTDMNTSSLYRRIPSLLIGCTLFASCLLSSGCAQLLRYPAVVVTPEKDGELALSLDTAYKSDNPLMEDLSALVKKGQFWRVSVFKLSDGKLRSGSDWKSILSESKVVLTGLPMEVLLRGDIEVCPSDNKKVCSGEDPKAADIVPEGRSILFLLHKYPD